MLDCEKMDGISLGFWSRPRRRVAAPVQKTKGCSGISGILHPLIEHSDALAAAASSFMRNGN
jgi:hypothetical protein